MRGLGKISEANVSDSLREVRFALLDADVNFKVVRDFIEKVRAAGIAYCVASSARISKMHITLGQTGLLPLFEHATRIMNVTTRARDLRVRYWIATGPRPPPRTRR